MRISDWSSDVCSSDLRTRHIPLIQERLGDACLRYEIDKGLAGGEPGSAPAFVAACHIYSPTLETFQTAFGPHRAEIVADVAHYTDIHPLVQVSARVGGYRAQHGQARPLDLPGLTE